jgi:hypothetical protein
MSWVCSHNRSPIGPALEANASGWIRSIGAHLNISQQGAAIIRNAIRAAMPVPTVQAGT